MYCHNIIINIYNLCVEQYQGNYGILMLHSYRYQQSSSNGITHLCMMRKNQSFYAWRNFQTLHATHIYMVLQPVTTIAYTTCNNLYNKHYIHMYYVRVIVIIFIYTFLVFLVVAVIYKYYDK